MRCDKKGAGLVLIVTVIMPAIAQPNPNLITLDRGRCYGSCPAYLLQIDSSGERCSRANP